jgi:hypothetical protein
MTGSITEGYKRPLAWMSVKEREADARVLVIG